MKLTLRATVVLTLLSLFLRPDAAPATDQPSCDSVSPGFAVSYDPTADYAKSSIGTISISCTSNVPLTIQVDLGTGRSGSYSDRELFQIGGPNVLHYNVLFGTTNSPFGDGNSGTQHIQATVSPVNGSIYIAQSVHLVINPHQFAVPGQYSDTLAMTVQF